MIQYVILAAAINIGGFVLSLPFVYLQYFWSQSFITFVMSTIIFFFILDNWSIMKDLKEVLKDNENKILIKSNCDQEIADLHSKFFELNGTKDKLSAKNEKLTNLIKESNKMSQNNNELMTIMGKQALSLIEINANIAKISLFQSIHEKEKTIHEKEFYQNKTLNTLRKISSLNDISKEVYSSLLFKDTNCKNQLMIE
jgi:hypothetical protein